jgi:hypothetical protein
MNSTSLILDLIRMRSDPGDRSGVACPGCRHVLTLHQPDPQFPDRLLGTCDVCRAWSLIDSAAGLMLR